MSDLFLDRVIRFPTGAAYADPLTGDVVDAYPLTPMQKVMLLHGRRVPGFYVQQYVCTLREPLHLPRFRAAWQRLATRHPVLRTSFHLDASPEPIQRVHAGVELPWAEHDWRGLSGDGQEAALRAFLREDRSASFHPADAPLARCTLFQLADEAYRLVWTSHHALFDGHSRRVLLREVFDDYAACVEGREPAAAERTSFGEYVRWAEGAEPPDSRAFWEEELRGFEPPGQLAVEGGGGSEPRGRHLFELSAELASGLGHLARRRALTLNTVLQGAWAFLLGRYTGESDVVFGATRSCRRGGFAGAGEVVGLLSNSLPMRVRLDPRRSVADSLEEVRAHWVRMRPHERTHLTRIQEWGGFPGGTPLFETAFGFETETVQDALHRLGPPWRRRTFELLQWVSSPLTVIARGGERISLEMLYDPARFGRGAIGRMGEHFTAVLRAFVEDPAQPLGRIGMLARAERHRLLDELNPPAVPGPGPATIHALFAAQAARTPDAAAVVFPEEALTYGELERRSNRLAHHLARRGVGPDARVGVLLERGVELVVSILAVLKAGGCYLPLDPGYPAGRLALMLADGGARVLLTRRAHLASFVPGALPVVCLDEAAGALAREPVEAPRSGATDGSLAYVVYTSGSTGTPKGVMVAHRHVVQLVRETDYVRIGPGDRVAQASNASFDALAFEVWGALLNGATLVGIPREVLLSPPELRRVLRDERITTLYQTTALLNQLAREEPGIFAPLREVLFGGQAADADSVRRLLEAGGPRRLLHMYGPTETTAWCSWEQVEKVAGGALTVPVGRATRNQRIYLLDAGLHPVPAGVPGEAYVGGSGVVRGYLGRPALTAARFLPDPFTSEPGARMYRTGDRLRWSADGRLEFVGRVDEQVKIRGFRIEPGEIEAVLSAHAGVREARVIVREDEPGGKRLVAYVVGGAGVETLRGHLRRSLPEYMVPAAFVAVGRLPLTPNGKLDVKALPAPEGESTGDRHVAPRTPVEEVLAGIWAQVLRRERVGVDDGFFELGGHSLLAMRVLSRVREVFGVELPVHAIFEGPTVAEVARRVEESRRAELPLPPPIVPVERTAPPPLSFAQERLWLVDQLEGAGALYNLPVARRLGGALDVEALERALGEIVRRHEALRTAFREVDGALEQVIAPFGGFVLPLEDLSALDGAAREAEVVRRAGEDAARPFGLSAGPLFRARLLRLREDEHVLLLCMHHVASDGWSLGVLFRELAALYGAYREGRPSPLPEPAVQYADYAVWQRGHLAGDALERHLAYWREALAGAPELLDLPTDHPRPPVQSHRGARERIDLSAELLDRLRALGRGEGATLYMVLLGAFQLLLARYAGSDDVVVGSPVAGRPRRELEELIGYFANTLVLRTDLRGDPGFREVLRRVRIATLGGYEHQDLPFDRLVAELRPERSTSHSPLFQVTFTLDDGEAEWTLPGLAVAPVETGGAVAKFDLLLHVDAGARPGATLTYAADLFERGTIRRMLEQLERVLEQVAADADAPVAAVRLMGAAERAALLEAWSRKGAEFPPERCIHQRFEAVARRTPGAAALAFEGRSLSYRELNARANRLAHRLRALGVGPEVRVGVVLDRSAELVVAILAVLKAGGAYVPLDPGYPAERIDFVLRDAAVPVLVTARPILADLPAFGGRALCIDADAEAIAAEGDHDPPATAGVDSLAYVIYTSGSTGKPKGVQVTHANVVRLFDATHAWFGFGADDVWTLFHSCAFDFSVWEIWGALLYGGRLVVVPFLVTRSPGDFHRLLVDEGVTVLSQTPSAFKQLVQADLAAGGDPSALRLRHVVFGGEALDPQALRPWAERHGVLRPRLVNMYGITETTVHVTGRVLARADLDRPGSPIGVPIPDLALCVLDARGEPVPPGVAGEIYVGGAGVARGYLNRPGLTARRFVPSPFPGGPGARLYRTGDLARRRADGELEYLGRADQQVKIRGFRIETGEIEAVLASHAGVAAAAVVARDEGGGERRLVAYVVAAPGEAAPTPAELRAHLAGALPDYMVPAAFVPLDRLPLTENGKLDRRALPAPHPAGAVAACAYAAPRTAAERALAGVWEEVLGVERVGIDDNYFALGGDSIRSVRLVAAARRRGLAFSIPQLYRHQTVRELAGAAGVAEATAARDDAEPFALLGPAARAALPGDVEDAYPVSQVQLGMLYHSERDPASLVYHEVLNYRVRTRFDEAAMREALRRVAERHPLLRTSFDLAAVPEPLQRVHRGARVPLEVQDLSHLDPAGQDAWVDREKWRGFDWTVPPLVRIHVHLLGGEVFRLIVVEHHAALDGWSVASLATELLRLHGALRDGAELPPLAPPASRFRDFVALEREAVACPGSRAFWRRVVHDAHVAPLPPREGDDVPRPDEAPCVWVELSAATTARLRGVAERATVPLKTVLLAAYLRTLALIGGSDDVVCGYVASGRPEAEDGEQVLGVFLNTVPLRVTVEPGSWLELVRRTWAAEDALLPHRRFPLSEIVRETGGRTPFEAAFNFVHFHVYDSLAAAGVRLESDRSFQRTESPLLACAMMASSGELRLRLEFNPVRLGEPQVRAMAGWLARALDALATRPEERWDAGGLLDAEEKVRLRLLAGGRAVDSERRPVHRLVHAQAARTPHAVAVACGGASLTYRELDARAGRLAARLVRVGAGPDRRVGVCFERSLELVVSLLAVLKAGAAWVPLDPEQPADRLGWMLADSGAGVLLADRSLAGRFEGWAGERLLLDGGAEPVGEDSPAGEGVDADPETLAYVIYTSGSTGRPKGVGVPHGALSSQLQWMQRAFPLSAGDRVLQKTAAGFDASVWEIWAPLVAGATLVMALSGAHRDPGELLAAVRRERITVLQLVPAVLRVVLEHPAAGECGTLRRLFCGGEALPADLAERARALTGAEVVNLYGPTEACIQAVAHVYAGERGATVPIGTPVDNVQAWVLDAAGAPVPPGVPGELYLGGAQLARGYLGQPGLTAGRFVPDPFAARAGARLYRTGDRVRWREAGVLEFLGRVDQQVKVRGFRVETGEVEAVLRGHAAVADCVVQARDDARGETRLVAYVVPAPGPTAAAPALRAHLRERLPESLVPSIFVTLDALPLTPSGKVDRRGLPAPEAARGAGVPVAPRDGLELRLARLWEEALGTGGVGVRDDFFDLGGHSLVALRLLAGVEQLTGRRIAMSTLLAAPTVEQMAATLRSEAAFAASGPLVPMQRAGSRRPLFFVHAAGGNVASYVPLARALGPDQPFYALQSRGLEGDEAPHTRVEDMAADYLAQLQAVQPGGPYRLGGWSMGGLVAFEMARMLGAAGEEVELLALVDSRAPGDARTAGLRDAPGLAAAFLLHLGGAPDRVERAARELGTLAEGERLRWAWEVARTSDLVSPGLDLGSFGRLWNVFRANVDAAAAYRPGPCASDPLLILAEHGGRAVAAEAARWEALTTGTVRSATVPGSHFTLLQEPHVRELAALVAVDATHAEPAGARA